MKNGLVLLAVGLSVVSFGGMMRIKTDVQQMVRQREKLAVQQLQLRETKRVLEAEYAMLISPLRLTELAQPRGYEELTMYRLMQLRPHGVSASMISTTETPGMTLAAALQVAKAASPSAVSVTVASSKTQVVSSTRVVPMAQTSRGASDTDAPVGDDINR